MWNWPEGRAIINPNSFKQVILIAEWLLKCSEIGPWSTFSRVTICPSLPRLVLVYTYCPGIIISSAPFHSQTCPSLEDKLYRHSSFETTVTCQASFSYSLTTDHWPLTGGKGRISTNPELPKKVSFRQLLGWLWGSWVPVSSLISSGYMISKKLIFFLWPLCYTS